MRPSVARPGGAELDQVRLTGLRAFGRHGVLPEERERGQTFLADVVLHLDTRAAAATDDLAATVSYADVAEDVVAVLGGEPFDLLETVAARAADRVLARGGVEAVDVTVHKPEAPIRVPFADVAVTVRRRRAPAPPASAGDASVLSRRPAAPVGFVVSAGGNVGDVPGTLRQAAVQLANRIGVEITAASPLARTAPVLAPGAPAQPDYLNATLVGRTTLSPRELLDACHAVEAAHGRRRVARWGERTLDLDVVSVGDLVAADDALELPHPRACERAFVLLPWLAADPGAVLPGHGRVADLARQVPGKVEWVEGTWFPRAVPAPAGPVPPPAPGMGGT